MLTVDGGTPSQQAAVWDTWRTATHPDWWVKPVTVVFSGNSSFTGPGGTIVISETTFDGNVWWVFLHELGHLADYWVLTAETRQQVLDELGEPLWSYPVKEAWADSFARTYTPPGRTFTKPHRSVTSALVRQLLEEPPDMSLLAELEAAGLTVNAHPDWDTNTNSGRDRTETVGVVNHWDAIKGEPPVSKYLVDNRFGGILYHMVIRRSGLVELLSQRYVWHAGQGSSQILEVARLGGPVPDDSAGPDDTNGNPHFFSVCVNYHPDEGPLPEAQYAALVAANRVLVERFGLTVGQVFRHMDWTTRKRDIDTISLHQFREDIQMSEFTQHEIEELKRLVASLDSVGSNGGFAEHAVKLIRKERDDIPLESLVPKGSPGVIRGAG